MTYIIEAYNKNNEWVSTSSYCGGVTRHSLIYALLAKFVFYTDDYNFVVRQYKSPSLKDGKIAKKISGVQAKEMLLHFEKNGGFDLSLDNSSDLRHYSCCRINSIFKGVFSLS